MANTNSIMSTASNPRSWSRDFDEIVIDQYPLIQDLGGMLYKMEKPMAGEHFIKKGLDITIGNAREMREGNPVQYDAFTDGPQKTVYPSKFGLGIQATLEAHTDGRRGHLKKAQAQLAKSMAITKQLKMADLFNSAFSTSRLGIDSKALIASDHPLYGAGASTYSNLETGALSKTTFQNAINKFNKLVDENNRPIVVVPKVLVIPPELEWVAKELLLTELEVGTANNTINTLNTVGGTGSNFQSKISYVVHRWLSSTTAWFMLSDKDMHDLCHIDWDMPKPKTYVDDNTDNVIYKITARFTDTFWNWRGIVGSTGV